jgi:hypothetical protein
MPPRRSPGDHRRLTCVASAIQQKIPNRARTRKSMARRSHRGQRPERFPSGWESRHQRTIPRNCPEARACKRAGAADLEEASRREGKVLAVGEDLVRTDTSSRPARRIASAAINGIGRMSSARSRSRESEPRTRFREQDDCQQVRSQTVPVFSIRRCRMAPIDLRHIHHVFRRNAQPVRAAAPNVSISSRSRPAGPVPWGLLMIAWRHQQGRIPDDLRNPCRAS